MESALREGGRDPDLKLIETLLWTGSTAPRWPLHLARLTRSVARLGWPTPPHDLPSDLPLPNHPARIRLTFDQIGQLDWQITPLGAIAAEWRIGLALPRLRSTDPWLGLKSTRRALHDQVRAGLTAAHDELLFLNERGEVAEGTITNVFFDRGQGLRTPPLSAGALPGVLRSELGCPEDRLLPEELPHIRLWVGNALRGLIPARFSP